MAGKVQCVFWLHVMKIKFSITHAGGSTAKESGVSGHSEHCECLWGDFPFKVLLKAVDNYVI